MVEQGTVVQRILGSLVEQEMERYDNLSAKDNHWLVSVQWRQMNDQPSMMSHLLSLLVWLNTRSFLV